MAVGLAGCSATNSSNMSSGAAVDVTAFANTQPSGGDATAAGLTRLMNASATDDPSEYRISPLDTLQISVFQVPDLTKTVRVAADGQITLALIGQVNAAGKTAHQLETEIAGRLGSKYLQSPEVTVFVSDAVNQRVTVEGAVAKPGIYPIVGQTTLMQVVALSGGLSDTADEKAVVVFRNIGGKRQAAVFDYKSIHSGKVNDPVLQGGDIVAVDQSGAKAALRNLRETIGVFNLFTPLVPLI